MDNKKLKVKDLVSIGVFGVIYLVLLFGIGMMGIIPILFLIYPTVLGIVAGTVVMLFMTKVQKPWALFIFGMISPLVMFAAGHTYVVVVLSLIVMIIAELIRKIGNYNSFKYNMLSYAVFSIWICSSMMQMLLAKEKYLEMSIEMMGKDYVDAMEKLITYPHMALVALGAFLGGILGAYIGKALLKKHFEKAGIV
ncbi:MptD family putative ECF transporter S component [Peptoniphilus gorbachii]|uniref:Energy-coupling factor transport system substrate-specific component n=1 Tax=Peptoniphilus gorbachii TaxID=411567 RepID=A0ABS2MLY0_9FIRM|nr:MptD family putative ECF transporter S component [Peptoniphilus gorbachii]MBM7551031.1 energy-coupling factor transport system substrate-specific component [Peptoniphilus gorbachii]MDU1023133.1 MptD family putative ECF transporter S component [Peptoniphilus harei]MDU1664558.1 MptD family putative ECF transporter S component [Peptoniphilus harei]MDU5467021.1 MptD family putative ECF transporter S component [Peptoniphilus harei]